MSLKEDIKDLFSFSSRERRGITVLLFIILNVFIVNILYPKFHKEKKYDFSEFEKEIDSFEAQKKPIIENTYETRLDKAIIERYNSLKLFDFDPNNLNEETGLKLGLTEKQIKTILNAVKKGYRFYDNEDFRKMYGIRQKQYEILKPYIKINTSKLQQFQRFKNEKPYQSTENEDSLFSFDPNTATVDNWKQLGFNDKQIKTIQNYTSKGGKFKTSEDLKKIYGIKPEQYEKIKDYITIYAKTTEKITETNIIDLNTDDVEKLKSYGGFWKYNAEKIVKYRIALGGFISKSQLYELYGIKKEYVAKITDSVYVDLSKVLKIRINFADKEEFKHPYLTWKNAKDIVYYRDKNGPFENLKSLQNSRVIPDSVFKKIYRYLTEK
jgi:DNA uptake protein ComE-like DNA-binding protein